MSTGIILYHKNGAYFTYHHLLEFLLEFMSKTLAFNLNKFFVQTWLRQTMIWLFIIELKIKDGELIITNLFHKKCNLGFMLIYKYIIVYCYFMFVHNLKW